MDRTKAPLIIIKRQFHLLNEQIMNAYPDETGGFFAGKDDLILGIFPVQNRRDSAGGAATKFSISEDDIYFAQKFFKDNQLKIMGMYHSHPNGVPIPSEKDMSHLVGEAFGRYHLIVGITPHNALKRKFNVAKQEPAYKIRVGLFFCPSSRQKIAVPLKIVENSQIHQYMIGTEHGGMNPLMDEYLKLEEKISQMIINRKVSYEKRTSDDPARSSFNTDT